MSLCSRSWWTTPRRSPAKLLAVMAAACMMFGLFHAVWCAWYGECTWDEGYHFEYVQRLVHTGETERESRPYFDSKTPLLVLNVMLGDTVGLRDRTFQQALFVLRLPGVLHLLALYLTAFFLARRLWGTEAGYLAVIAASLDPNLTAHAALLTVDLPFATATLLVIFCALRFWEKPDWKMGIYLGLSIGLAFTTKFTAVMLVPLAIFLPPLCKGIPRRLPFIPRARTVAALLLAFLAAWLVIAASYQFRGLGSATGYTWDTTAMQLLGRIPLLTPIFPFDFLRGLDIVMAKDATTQWNSVILMTRHPDGVWYYFALLWLVKTPIPLLLLGIAGLWATIRSLLRHDAHVRTLACALILMLAYFCLVFRTHVGFRFVLMCLPLLYVLAAGAFARRTTSRIAGSLLIAGAFWAVAEQAPFSGNLLSFSNSFIIDKRLAYRILADSNIDWRQNHERAQRWADARPNTVVNPAHLLPGVNVLSANYFLGIDERQGHQPRSPFCIARKPDRHLFHSHLIFRVSPTEFQRILNDERTLDEVEPCPLTGTQSGAGLILIDADPIELSPGERINLFDDVVCVEAREPSDITLTSDSFSPIGLWVSFGAFRADGFYGIPRYMAERMHFAELLSLAPPNLEWNRPPGGERVWYRLRRATYVFYMRGGAIDLQLERGKVVVRSGPLGKPPFADLEPSRPLECADNSLASADGPDLYVRGNWSDWAPWKIARMVRDGGCLRAALPLERGTYSFKIGARRWDIADYGARSRMEQNVELDREKTLAARGLDTSAHDLLFKARETGYYVFQLRLGNKGRAPILLVSRATRPVDDQSGR